MIKNTHIAILSLFAIVVAFVVVPGHAWNYNNDDDDDTCPDTLPVLMSSFNVNEYTGRWYEIARFRNTPFENGVCVTADYSIDPEDPDGILVVNTERLGSPDGEERSVRGYAFAPDSSVPAKLTVRFEGSPVDGDYQVLGTDYETWALVYSCSEFEGEKVEYAWILSREPTLEERIVDQLMDQLEEDVGADSSKFMETQQEGCW